MMNKDFKCHICSENLLKLIKKIDKKPSVEVDYQIPTKNYLRHIYKCRRCKVYFNKHNLLNKDFYNGKYNESIDGGKLKARFEKIISLSPKNSDNKNRVFRIDNFYKNQSRNSKKVLDIGSGTCVFLYEMKKLGYKTYCIDPDPVAIEHARSTIKVDGAYCGNIFDNTNYDSFGLITFNKVLEHLLNPIDYLKKSKDYLNKDGILYIELPEGDKIVEQELIEKRAEFAIEHYYVFNQTSMNYLLTNSGFKIIDSDIITDPSGKYTIYAFAKKI